MSKLEQVYDQSRGSEEMLEHRSVLFIGSESYDAPTITVIQGLSELGFDVYTIKKSNINSWFCDTRILDPSKKEFDFVLSNLHWGTRWEYYNKYDLSSYSHVLIDGDDNPGLGIHWRDKFEEYQERYEYDPPTKIKNRELMPYRWVQSLSGYEPDVVFTAQKQTAETESHYIPFGIHDQYDQLAKDRSLDERSLNLTHIPGPGKRRSWMRWFISILDRLQILPGKVHNEEVRGKAYYPDDISYGVKNDDNIHSYHRWKLYEAYFEVLNDSQILVYPGIDTWPFWDSKRPWEALSCGCFVMMARPEIDVSEYPITELCEYAVFDSHREFVKKYRHLVQNPDKLDKLRTQMITRAEKYFRPTPIARYFLQQVVEEIN